jgi:hypothetical protein
MAFSIGSNGSAGVASRANSARAWKGSGRLVAPSGLKLAPPALQFGHLHDVLRQRAGLVGGQHGDGAQRLDR